MKGRKPKPTKLKILAGNPGRRPILPEPEPIPGAPRMPSGMPSVAQGVWKQLVPELDRLGLLTIVDGGALEAACRGLAQGRAADKAVDRIQRLCNSAKAEQKDFYQLSIMSSVSKKGWQQWKTFCTEFGLTPSSRARLSGSAEDKGKASKVDYIERSLSA